jgi:hypothetical protein
MPGRQEGLPDPCLWAPLQLRGVEELLQPVLQYNHASFFSHRQEDTTNMVNFDDRLIGVRSHNDNFEERQLSPAAMLFSLFLFFRFSSFFFISVMS